MGKPRKRWFDDGEMMCRKWGVRGAEEK